MNKGRGAVRSSQRLFQTFQIGFTALKPLRIGNEHSMHLCAACCNVYLQDQHESNRMIKSITEHMSTFNSVYSSIPFDVFTFPATDLSNAVGGRGIRIGEVFVLQIKCRINKHCTTSQG